MTDDQRRDGRDELNLAEFPLTFLADRATKGVKTLIFEGQHGKLTVSGSDDFGLPTAADADVIVALTQLTKLANGFTNPSVSFTRYEALAVLGWPDDGRHYRRLGDSLRRWVGVTLRYDKSWWSNDIKCRIDANFHILESVILIDQETRRTLHARHQPLPLSSFTWNGVFFKSCLDGNLKRFDTTTYFGLRSSVSKQAYRFLDKRFYIRKEWSFDLRQFAVGHVGLSSNYSDAKLREKLKPALEELEHIGFLRPMLPADRYTKVGRDRWQIRLARKGRQEAVGEP